MKQIFLLSAFCIGLSTFLLASDFVPSVMAQGQWRSFDNDTVPSAGWAQPSSPARQSHSLLVDRSGNVWLAYGPYGLIRYNGQSWNFLDTSDGLLNDTINTMTCDTAGNIWFAGKGAIYKYDGAWHSYSIPDQLRGYRNFQAIACDSNNTIWAASLSWIFTGRYIQGIPVDSLVAEIFTFDGSNWKPFNISVANPGGWQGVQAIACSKGSVWCVAWQADDSSDNYSGGLYRFNGNGWDGFDLNTGTVGNFPREPTDICIDSDGVVWITSTYTSTPYQGYPGNISSFDGANWRQYRDSSLITGNEFFSITLDSIGRKWVGSQAGAIVIDGNNISSITTKNGLLSNMTYTIAFGKDGNTWFGTSLGLEELIASASIVASEVGSQQRPVTFYPNPATSSISITNSNGPLSILDPLGRSYEVKQTGNTLDVSALPSGVYFVSDGHTRAKFVKE